MLLNLWATWCVPCRAEMPALDRLQAAKGGPGFEVVAVNVDTARLERRAAFLDSIGVKSLARFSDPSGDAFETLRRDGKALGLPVTLVIDKDGCEVGAVEGGIKWDSAEAQALVGGAEGRVGAVANRALRARNGGLELPGRPNLLRKPAKHQRHRVWKFRARAVSGVRDEMRLRFRTAFENPRIRLRYEIIILAIDNEHRRIVRSLKQRASRQFRRREHKLSADDRTPWRC